MPADAEPPAKKPRGRFHLPAAGIGAVSGAAIGYGAVALGAAAVGVFAVGALVITGMALRKRRGGE